MDRWIWKHDNGDEYSVKETYDILANDPIISGAPLYHQWRRMLIESSCLCVEEYAKEESLEHLFNE